MSKEFYYKVVDEAYLNFLKNTVPHDRQETKDEFVKRIVTDKEFSERWCLKIVERELSLEERKKLYEDEFTPGMEVKNDEWLESKLKTRNIPTKEITVTYENNTVSYYE